jgi:hypothetical protein
LVIHVNNNEDRYTMTFGGDYGFEDSTESMILSAGGAESIILSAGRAESMMLSECALSMILSAPPAESMILQLMWLSGRLTL